MDSFKKLLCSKTGLVNNWIGYILEIFDLHTTIFLHVHTPQFFTLSPSPTQFKPNKTGLTQTKPV